MERRAIRSLALGARPPNLGGSNVNVCSLVGAERRVRSRAPGDGCRPQHRVNGCIGAKHRVRGCNHPSGRRGFRGHFIARGGGIRGDGSPRQSDRRRLQGPQRHDFKD